MKILYGYKYGILGGVCTQLINRLHVLERSGAAEAHLVFWRDMGISRTLAGRSHVYFESDASRFLQIVRAGRYDVVVVIDTPEYLEALSQQDQVPVVVEIHTTTALGLGYLEGRRWPAAGYIVPSDYSRAMLKQRFGIGDGDPVMVVPDSIEPELFPRVEVPWSGVRPVFGWVGKLDEHKDWRTLLKLAANITERGADAEFWIVGGETAPADLQDEVIDQIERLNLHSRCRWFPRIEYRAMHRLYAAVRASDGAVLVTSIDESFGMSVLESLLCGCPVLASRVGALPELAPNRSYLRFYELGDVEAAAVAAMEWLAPQQASRLRRELDADRSWLLEQYSAETVTPRYLRALTELIQ